MSKVDITFESWYIEESRDAEQPSRPEELKDEAIELLEDGFSTREIPDKRYPALKVLMVDGVRRTFARLLVRYEERFLRGLLAGISSGGVLVDLHRREMSFLGIHEPELFHLVVAVEEPEESRAPSEEELRSALNPPENWHLMVRTGKPDKFHDLINEAMSELEVEYTRRYRDRANILLSDGTLRKFREKAQIAEPLVGIVKTHIARHYPLELEERILTMPAGNRSPLFKLIRGRYTLLTFYLKLSDHPGFSGLLRLEMTEEGLRTLTEVTNSSSPSEACDNLSKLIMEIYAVNEVDMSSLLPRWPRNPLALEWLERALKHRLPSHQLMRRMMMLRREA